MVDKKKKFTVYVVTNTVTGHRYVGCTSVGLEKRKKRHFVRFKYKKWRQKFHDALREHPELSFDWQVSSTFADANEAFAEEVRLIAELKPEYNVAAGGLGTPGVPSHNRKTVTCLEDGQIFESLTHAAKFYNLSTVTVYNVCCEDYRSAKGYHFIFGDHLYSEAERMAMIREIEKKSAQRRKRVAVNKTSRGVLAGKDSAGRSAAGPMKVSRKVICLDDGMVYPSASEAGRHYNVAKSAIIELCLGKNNRKTAGGLRFKYEGV